MSDIDAQTRVNLLRQPNELPRVAVPPVKARNRRERLAIGLAHLERSGVSSDHAYPFAFRKLARIGLVIKPFHYWSGIALTVFMMAIFSVISTVMLILAAMFGHLPRFAVQMIDLGPNVFFGVALFVGIAFAASVKMQVSKLNLPLWRHL